MDHGVFSGDQTKNVWLPVGCKLMFQHISTCYGLCGSIYVGVNPLAKTIWTIGPQRDRAITRDLRWEMSATCLCIREWKNFAIHKPNTFAQSRIIQAHTLKRFQHIGNTIICLAKSEKQKNENNWKNNKIHGYKYLARLFANCHCDSTPRENIDTECICTLMSDVFWFLQTAARHPERFDDV